MQIRTIHPFPARMAPDLALRSLSKLPKGSIILDPMAGSGTVLRQALQLGHRAIGFDVDPLAVLMSRVWTSPIDPEAVLKELHTVVEDARDVDLRTDTLPWHDEETEAFVGYWFATRQRRDLTRLAYVLHHRLKRNRSEARRLALDVIQVALSRLIVTKDQVVSLARDTSHSRPHRVTDTCTFDLLPGLERSVEQLMNRIQASPAPRSAKVALGDARALPLRKNSVDQILSSPPYLNQIDYMRGHRLALVWLGYSLSELRAIRGGAIGTERGLDDDGDADMAIVRAMTGKRPVSSRHQAIIQRYANDLRRLMLQSARVLRRGGRASFVIGNSCLRDAFVRNSTGLIKAGRMAGLELVSQRQRALPDANRYLPITEGSALAKRMRTETVLTFEH